MPFQVLVNIFLVVNLPCWTTIIITHIQFLSSLGNQQLFSNWHNVESSVKTYVNTDDVVTIGIRVLINGSSVLLENEKIDKNILKNEWKLIDVTLSTFVIIMIYVFATTYENRGTYITLLNEATRHGLNAKICKILS